MPKTELTTAQKERRASKVVHVLPWVWLTYGAFLGLVYAFVGDTPYFLVAAYIFTVYLTRCFAKYQQRHTVMRTCTKCTANTQRGKANTLPSRFFRWYFHRRIIDSKAAMLILHAGIIVTVVYEALGKPHAEMIFLIGLEVFIVQMVFLMRSATIHRAYETSCPLCARGDDPFLYGRVTESELTD